MWEAKINARSNEFRRAFRSPVGYFSAAKIPAAAGIRKLDSRLQKLTILL